MIEPEIQFDQARHVYTVDGRERPSVTQVLPSDFRFVDPAVLAAAAERGRLAHQAIELHDAGELDRDALDPELEPYLAGWIQFRADTRFSPRISEIRIYSKIHGFVVVGTPDVIGTIEPEPGAGVMARKSAGALVLVDVKTGVLTPAAKLQTAAYKYAYTEATGRRISRRLIVQVGPNYPRGYTVTEYTEHALDWSIFLAYLSIHKWETQNNVRQNTNR